MRCLTLAFVLLVAALAPADAVWAQEVRTVSIYSEGNGQIGQSLFSAITAKLYQGSELQLVQGKSDYQVFVQTLDHAVLSLSVYAIGVVYFADDLVLGPDFAIRQLDSILGYCSDDVVDACASDVVGGIVETIREYDEKRVARMDMMFDEIIFDEDEWVAPLPPPPSE